MPLAGSFQQIGEGDLRLSVAVLCRVFGGGDDGVDKVLFMSGGVGITAAILSLLHKIELVVDVVVVLDHPHFDRPELGIALEDLLREEGEVVVDKGVLFLLLLLWLWLQLQGRDLPAQTAPPRRREGKRDHRNCRIARSDSGGGQSSGSGGNGLPLLLQQRLSLPLLPLLQPLLVGDLLLSLLVY